MAGATGNGRGGVITEINVTPLVDVVLVVLIIFMATAPLLQKRVVNVNVPKAAHGEKKATAALSITLSLDGKVYVEKDAVEKKDIASLLKSRLAAEPALHVSVAADRALAYGDVAEFLDDIRGAGVKKVALEVKPK